MQPAKKDNLKPKDCHHLQPLVCRRLVAAAAVAIAVALVAVVVAAAVAVVAAAAVRQQQQESMETLQKRRKEGRDCMIRPLMIQIQRNDETHDSHCCCCGGGDDDDDDDDDDSEAEKR